MSVVGVVGLGVMGGRCAAKLMERGMSVLGYDPFPAAADRAAQTRRRNSPPGRMLFFFLSPARRIRKRWCSAPTDWPGEQDRAAFS